MKCLSPLSNEVHQQECLQKLKEGMTSIPLQVSLYFEGQDLSLALADMASLKTEKQVCCLRAISTVSPSTLMFDLTADNIIAYSSVTICIHLPEPVIQDQQVSTTLEMLTFNTERA